jgi:signal transduction histidine kinase
MGRRFLATFILLLLPFIAAGWIGVRSATSVLRKQTHEMLRVASNGAEAQVREFLLSIKRTTDARAVDGEIRSALKSPEQSRTDLSDLLRRLQTRIPEAREIFCMNLEGGVVASSSPGMIGTDQSSSLEFQRGRESFNHGDIVREAGTGAIRWRTSAPVKDPDTGTTLGVVAVGFDPAALSALTSGKRVLAQGAGTQSFRMGKSGETYIVNRNGLLLTESRFAPNSVLKLKVETAPVRAALERNEEIIADYKDYRGVTVSGASSILTDVGWILVTEMDFRQAFAPLYALRKVLTGIFVLTALIAVWVARRFAKHFVDPLRVASEADRSLARGEEDGAIVPEKDLPKDELGDFIRQRNANVRSLFKHERELLKEQERRAEAARALEGISYSMVHDMRAPLRSMIAFGDLVTEHAGDRLTPSEKSYLDRMKQASLRMDHLICDMLRYSSLLNADVPLHPVNMPDLLRDIIEANPFLMAMKANIRINEPMPLVQANAAVLGECFSVLLDNALRYTRPDVTPMVRVWADTHGSWTKVFVEDNGTGMSKAFQRKLFGIFQRGTNAAGGNGIGLALVRVAMERMGGCVGVESEEGKGSRFWIELKPADSAVQSTAA